MDFLKKHADSVSIIITLISSIVVCMLWMNSKFNHIDERFFLVNERFSKMQNEIDNRFSTLEKDIAIVKTAMIMKNILTVEMAHHEGEK